MASKDEALDQDVHLDVHLNAAPKDLKAVDSAASAAPAPFSFCPFPFLAVAIPLAAFVVSFHALLAIDFDFFS